MATEESFLNNVANHQMTIICDDGVNRHIRFAIPGHSEMQFDLITWPGYLCYTGDMGTYVFKRLADMFYFFASKNKSLYINPGYWAEKIEAHDKNGGVKEFDEDIFNKVVMDYLKTFIRDHYHTTNKETRRELWDRVVDEIINADSDSGGFRKQAAAYDFQHKVDNRLRFSFIDLWEHDLTSYTYHYLWCCYALVWGIGQYNQSKVNSELECA